MGDALRKRIYGVSMPSAALAGLWRLLASLIVSTIVYVYWAIGMGLMASMIGCAGSHTS